MRLKLGCAPGYAALALALLTSRLAAQGGIVGTSPTTSVTVGVGDASVRPPISPRRAFLSSLFLPGYAQTRLGRPTAGALFAGAEMIGIAMLLKARGDLRQAQRLKSDSVAGSYIVDPATGLVQRDEHGNPRVQTRVAAGPPPGLIGARKTHVEDWIAALVANHFISGVDAYVAAHLWGVETEISPDAGNGRLRVGATIPW